MKRPKGLLIVFSIIMLMMFALFPVTSEATSYALVQVFDNKVIADGNEYTISYFSTVNQSTNTIGTLTFYTTTTYSLIANATIGKLTVETGANVDLQNPLGSANVEVNGGTIQSNVKTLGTVTNNGGLIQGMVTGASYVNTNPPAKIENPAGGAIGDTTGNVGVTSSTLTVKNAGIRDTAGNVTVTDSTISAGANGIARTGGNVTVADSTISAGNNGIIDVSGDLYVTKSDITATSGDAVRGVSGKVDINNDSKITANGGSGVNVDGAKKVNISESVVSADKDGIIAKNTGVLGVSITNTEVTAGGDGINISDSLGPVNIADTNVKAIGNGINVSGSLGVVRISDTKVVAGEDGIKVSDNSVYGNEINNLDINAVGDGLDVKDTVNLTVNLTKKGSIVAKSGIIASGNTDININSASGSSLDITAETAGMSITGGAKLNDNVETVIKTTADDSNGIDVRDTESNANFTKKLTIDALGSDSAGIRVSDGGKFNASDEVNITMQAGNSSGINVSSADSIATIDGITTIEMLGDNSTGVYAGNSGTVNLNGGLELDATATGPGEMKGLFAENNGNINVSGGSINVHSTGGDAYGAVASGDSLITFNNFGDITVVADEGDAYGLYADPSTISGDVESITVTALNNAYGAVAYSESTIDAVMSGDILVTSTGTGEAIGIGAETSSDVMVEGLTGLTVKATAGRAIGIGANDESTADVSMTGDINVETEGGKAHGAAASDGSEVYLTGAEAMVVKATTDAFGVDAYNLSTVSADVESINVTAGAGAYGATAVLDSEIDLLMSGDMVVESTGTGEAVGIGALTSGDVTVDGLANLTVKAATGRAMGIAAQDDSIANVSMTGNIDVESSIAGEAVGIGAETSSDVMVEGLTGLTVKATAGRAIGIGANDESTADVSMTGDINVETEGGKAHGAAASDGSEVYLTGAEAMVVKATTDAFGVDAYNLSTVSADVESIEVTAGAGAYGATAVLDSEIDLLMSGDMVVESTGTGEAVGIGALTSGDVTVDGLANLTVKAATGRAMGIAAQDDSIANVSMTGNIDVESSIAGEAVGIGAETSSDVMVEGLTGLTVKATAGRAIGIGANDESTADVSMTGDINVETEGGKAHGAAASDGSEVYLTGAEAMVVKATTDAFGVDAYNLSTVSADVESINVTAGAGAYGATAVLDSEIDLLMSGDMVVESTGTGEAVGIGALTSGDVTVDGLANLTVKAATGRAMGIAAQDDSIANVSMTGNIDVESSIAGEAVGIGAETSSDVMVEGLTGLTVKATAGRAIGIGANDESTADVSMTGDINVETEGGKAHGAAASDGSEVYLTGAEAMVVKATTDAFGVDAYNLSTVSADVESIEVTAGAGAYGATAVLDSEIDLLMSGDMVVESTGTGEAVGIGALTSGDVTVDGLANLTVKAATGRAMGIAAQDDSIANVSMTGNIDVESSIAGEAVGIGAETSSDVMVEGLTGLTVKATAGRAIGIGANDESTADVSMTGDINVETEGGKAHGAAASDGSEVYLTGAEAMVVKATTDAFGVDAYNLSTVSADVESINVTAGAGAYGATAVLDSEIDLLMSGDMVVESTGTGEAVGIGALTSGDVTVDGLANLTVKAATGRAMGIAAQDDSIANVSMTGNIDVESSIAGEAVGIGAETSSDVMVEGLTGLTVKATAGRAIGIGANDESTADVSMTGDINVETEGGKAHGAAASDGSEVYLTGAEAMVVKATTDAFGVDAYNLSTVSADVESINVTAGAGAYGATAVLDSEIDLLMSGDMVVESTGTGEAVGIGALTSGDVTVDGLANLTVKAATGRAMGIAAQDDSIANVSMTGNIDVESSIAGEAVGIGAETSSDVMVEGLTGLTVKATDGRAIGIGANDESTADVSMTGDINVVAAGGDAYGAAASNASRVDLTGAKAMVVSSDLQAFGVDAFGGSIVSADIQSIEVTAGERAYGAVAEEYSEIDLLMAGDMLVTSTGTGEAVGIGALTSGDVTVDGLANLTVKAADGPAYGIRADDDSIANVTMNGDINVESTTDGGAKGIEADDGGSVTVAGLKNLSVKANDGSARGIHADDDGSTVNVTMDGNIDVESRTDGSARGIHAESGGIITVTGLKDLLVKSNVDSARGIHAEDDGSTVNVIMDGNIDVESRTDGSARGIHAESGGIITVTGLKDLLVKSNVDSARGIHAEDDGSTVNVIMDGNIDVESTTSYSARGIHADDGGIVTVTGLKDLSVKANTHSAHGIHARDNSFADVEMTGTINVLTNEGMALGINAEDESNVIVKMDADKSNNDIFVHSMTNGDAYGMLAAGDSNIVFENVRNLVVSADAGDAYGLFANDPSTISGDVESITVTASGNALGAVAYDDSIIDTTMSGDITVTSTGSGFAVGIGALTSADVNVDGLKNLTVKATDGPALGIGAADQSKTSVEMAGDIIVDGTDFAVGIGALDNSKTSVEMDGNITVKATSGDAVGLYAVDHGDVILTGGNLDVTGTGKVRGIFSADDSNVSMTDGNITINETADSAYMEVEGDGAIFLSNVTANTLGGEIIDEDRTLITTDSSGSVLADLGTVIGGNMIHTGANDGVLDITITGGSKIIGAASADMSNDDARINITLNSLADTWEVTADSYTNGTLTNRGIVDYRKVGSLLDYNDGTESGDFKTVTVANFIGNDSSTPEDETGILQMKADINGGHNDHLRAEESATGVNRLEIQNLTNSGVQRSGTLVHVEDNATDLELSIANPDEVNAFGQQLVHAGPWSYMLGSETDADSKEWYLERWSLTSTGVGIVSSMVNADTWYREVGTLLNRMGIYRDGEYYGGFWFEAAANKQEIDGGFGSQYDQQFTNFTVGWDKMYAKEKGDLFVGIMGGYGKADRDIGNIGTTDLESTHAALYGIYRTPDGFYATGLVKYNKYDNDMSLFGVDNFSRRLLAELGEDRVKGNWDQDGYGVSLQVGKRMDRENGWYLEPQAQLSWMKINGENYRTNTGIEVGIDDTDSFRGRLGLLVGRSMQLKDETKLDLFGSLSLVHEFEGETDITMSGGKWTSDLGGTWGVFGAGFNWNFQPGKYVHGGVSYATGDNREEPWGVYLGLSFEVGGTRSSKEQAKEAEVEVEVEAEAEVETEVETETEAEADVEPAA